MLKGGIMTNKELPKYTKGEEIFNAVSHIVGGAFGIIALVIGIIYAYYYGDTIAIVSMTVFGISMILLYTMSAIYHFLRPNRAKKVFRIFDHCTIYLLIAGTYTPFCLIALEGLLQGYIILGIVWGVSIVGITLNAVNMHWKAVKILSQISYILLGWCILFAFIPLVNTLSTLEFWLLVGGGISYTVGAIFFAFGSKCKYIHSIWHLFVLLGTVLQFASILLYIIYH